MATRSRRRSKWRSSQRRHKAQASVARGMCVCVRADAAAEFEIQNASKLTQLFWSRRRLGRKGVEQQQEQEKKRVRSSERADEEQKHRSTSREEAGAAAEQEQQQRKRSRSRPEMASNRRRQKLELELLRVVAQPTVRQCPAAGHTLAQKCVSRCRCHCRLPVAFARLGVLGPK